MKLADLEPMHRGIFAQNNSSTERRPQNLSCESGIGGETDPASLMQTELETTAQLEAPKPTIDAQVTSICQRQPYEVALNSALAEQLQASWLPSVRATRALVGATLVFS